MLRRVEAAGLRVSPFLVLTERSSSISGWRDRQREWMRSYVDHLHRGETAYSAFLLSGPASTCRNSATRFGDSKLAVRSSAHYEDGLHHSYAGMFSSMTFVPAHGEAIAKAVKNCWAALFTKELDEYRKIDTSQAAMDWYLPLMIKRWSQLSCPECSSREIR